jgi:hypothetical protein
MNLIVYVCIFITLAMFVMFVVVERDIIRKFKDEYPDIIIPRYTLVDKILDGLRLFMFAIVPFLNILILWLLVSAYDDVEEYIMNRMYKVCMREVDENGLS